MPSAHAGIPPGCAALSTRAPGGVARASLNHPLHAVKPLAWTDVASHAYVCAVFIHHCFRLLNSFTTSGCLAKFSDKEAIERLRNKSEIFSLLTKLIKRGNVSV